MGQYKNSFYSSYYLIILSKTIKFLLVFLKIFNFRFIYKVYFYRHYLFVRIYFIIDKKTLKFFLPVQGLKSLKYLRVNRNKYHLHLCRLLLLIYSGKSWGHLLLVVASPGLAIYFFWKCSSA